MFINSFSVHYPDIVTAERCDQCNCCTPCSQKCNCAAVEDAGEVQQVLRILGIDAEDSKIQQAERFRERFVAEELEKIEREGGNTLTAEDEQDEDEEVESEDDYETEDDY